MKAAAMNPRLLVLLAVAAVCGFLAFSGDEQTATPVAAVSRASINTAASGQSSRAAARRPSQALALDRLERPAPGASKQNLNPFAAAVWTAPPRIEPPKPVALPAVDTPPPKPRPPALPFQYFGHLLDGDTATVFLTQGGRNHAVKTGETIDNAYRVESITPERIVFRYLPLDETQELNRGTP